MGDQEVKIGLSLQGDIKNSQFELYYSYLPYRIDFMGGGFYRSYSDVYRLGGSELSWGFSGALIYPLSTFTRWQFNLNSLFIKRKSSGKNPQTKSSGIFSPTLLWSHDNTQWGYVGPINGERINARVSISPPLFDSDLFFAVGDLDFRKYWEFFKKYTLAFRVNAGLSEKISGYRNPHQYWLGGDDFLVLFPFDPNRDNIPEDTELETWYFSEFALPLRGYRFFEFRGNRKILANLEFRFPFINELIIAWPPPGLRFPPIAGIFFADYGAAWNTGSDFESDQGLGIGYGLRINLGVLVLRWTRAKPIEGIGNHKKSQTDYWSLGAEF
jgi:outer membrane protein assembly factor BamA